MGKLGACRTRDDPFDAAAIAVTRQLYAVGKILRRQWAGLIGTHRGTGRKGERSSSRGDRQWPGPFQRDTMLFLCRKVT